MQIWPPLICIVLNIVFILSYLGAQTRVKPLTQAKHQDIATGDRSTDEKGTHEGLTNSLIAQQPVITKTPPVPKSPVRKPPPPPSPAVNPVRDSEKSQEQKDYEAIVQKRFDELAKEIVKLNNILESLDEPKQARLRETLQTAAGNRSVVRTKIKQLKFIPPSQWTTLKNGIEKAFINLEDAIHRAKSYEEAQ